MKFTVSVCFSPEDRVLRWNVRTSTWDSLNGADNWLPTPSAQLPQSGHVVVVVEEHTSYSKIIGNSAMPYLNSLDATLK
jgi:hypothetical protein